jgi:small subunit ribosomal protein S6
MPRKYEAVYIFDSTLEDTAIQEKLTRFHELLSLSPETTTVDNWGRRQLAYPIGPRENGYYTVARFEAEPVALPEYERALKLDDGVVRYLITLHEHEVGAPPSTEGDGDEERPRASDDDDDDED